MTPNDIVTLTTEFVKKTLHGAEGGHDWFHIQRVHANANKIAESEEVDKLVVSLGALLHDIADAKFHDGDEALGPKIAKDFLCSVGVGQNAIEHVLKIIENISFKNSLDPGQGTRFRSMELQVVQDADRLDALGAIGIARAFNYGGFKNRALFDPEIPPNLNMTKEEYKKSPSPTINHFYEKLLLLKNRMNTETGKKMAGERHQFMLDYLEQFYKEWM
tara:strand:+ start:2295 stop:2948 length:654 start_codon:yes stop_codon:yes gene_type:complete